MNRSRGLSDLSLYILAALTNAGDAGRHGYALIRDIEREVGRRYTPPAVYAAIKGLMRGGSVEEGDRDTVNGRLRIGYRVSGESITLLRTEIARREEALLWIQRAAAKGGNRD